MRFLITALASSWGYFLRLFPTSVIWYFAVFLAWLWFDVFRIRRWTVLKNLSIAFPEKSFQERKHLARQSMRYLCFGFFEFCMLPTLREKWLQERIVIHGFDQYEKAHALGKGILFLSLHLGNGDLGIAALAMKKLKLNVISKTFRNPLANQFWFGVRERLGTRFLEAHGRSLPFEILKACRQKEGVIFVIDQFMGKPYGIETTFFGRKTGTAYGLSLFALKTGAPVMPIYSYWDEAFRLNIVFEEPVSLETAVENKDKDLQIQRMTQKYNDRVEAIVREHPEQWMWLHRRWKTWE